MNNYNIEFDFKEILYDVLSDTVEYSFCFDGREGYSLFYSDQLFETVLQAVEFAFKFDEYFYKCRNLSMIDFVVPVYNEDGELLHYLPYDEAILLRG